MWDNILCACGEKPIVRNALFISFLSLISLLRSLSMLSLFFFLFSFSFSFPLLFFDSFSAFSVFLLCFLYFLVLFLIFGLSNSVRLVRDWMRVIAFDLDEMIGR